ncbi:MULTISPECIES: hypothetical protein [Phocaeicola]|jgi:hypothetical protein|uniref:Uncharacterized protein n=1 Tax=Phocaeicola dorei CL03T12C01 TaxID=997877 RepID=I8WTT0_9BACT|nr:hypothetical protein [Phocaeicola dorei]AND20742.1 hypothetical protein ABI39_15990 [Phocaeicola dorei CL03T12C01]EIY42010.1 hypothetical protein HMPREF1065_00376 [Phocaeicola dorei CL03T12C01]DAS76746.1 MAG TPA: tail protein [Bacteriophage sp.]
MNELLINDKNAYTTWGVRMGDGFLDVIGASAPMKDFIENKSRLEHGKRVIINNPKVDEREITLSFTIEGNSQSDYQAKKKAFFGELYKGAVDIKIPANSSEIYHLIYTGKSVTYAQSLDRTFGKVSMKFSEPNPANRS